MPPAPQLQQPASRCGAETGSSASLWSSLPVCRPAEDLPRDTKASTDVNHNSVAVTTSGHGPAKTVPPSASSAASSNTVLSSFLYGMPMSSKPHPDGKLDFKAMSFLSLGKDRGSSWTDKMAVKDCASGGELHTLLVLLGF